MFLKVSDNACDICASISCRITLRKLSNVIGLFMYYTSVFSDTIWKMTGVKSFECLENGVITLPRAFKHSKKWSFLFRKKCDGSFNVTASNSYYISARNSSNVRNLLMYRHPFLVLPQVKSDQELNLVNLLDVEVFMLIFQVQDVPQGTQFILICLWHVIYFLPSNKFF